MPSTIPFSRQQRITNTLLLNASFIDNLGLMHGKMGIAIYFFHLARETKNQSKYSMGEVGEKVIIDANEIAKKYSSFYEHLEKLCKYCYLYRFCSRCMFEIKDLDKLNTGKFHICDSFHSQNEFRSKLFRVFSFLEKHPNYYFEILEDIVIDA